jgi:hypothetical protein
MNLKLASVVTCLVLVTAGCGDGPTTTGPSPTRPETSFLTGTWSGPVMVRRAGLPDSPGTATWTFALVPNSGGSTFATTVTIQHPWLAISSTPMTTALYAPMTPGARISTIGFYASLRGCQGSLGSEGVAEESRIEANLTGAECLQLPETGVFSGTVTLTKVQ